MGLLDDFSLIFLIGGLLLAGFSVYLFVKVVFKTDGQSQSLAWAAGDEPAKSKSPIVNFSRPLIHNFTIQYAPRIKSKSYREKVRKKIVTGGLSGELNVDEFIGMQILWGVMFPILIFILNFTLELGLSTPICVVLGLLGAAFPHMYASSEKKKRYQSVILDLPFFVDLLALSTKAGLDFTGSIRKICEKAQDSVLADEFALVLRDTQLGSTRTEALRAMADRLDMSEITSLVAVIVNAEKTGTAIDKVLKDQSDQMRLERFVRAEKAGANASQALLIPIMLFIVPAVFIMVLAPVALSFQGGG